MMGEEGGRQGFIGMAKKTTSDPSRLQELFLPVLLHLAKIPSSELLVFKPNGEASYVWKK